MIFGPIFGRLESPSEVSFEAIFGHPESSFEGDLRTDLRSPRVDARGVFSGRSSVTPSRRSEMIFEVIFGPIESSTLGPGWNQDGITIFMAKESA